MGVRRELGGGQEGVKNVYPSSKSASKTCTLRQKVGLEASKTCTLRQKVRQKHVPLGRKSASKRRKRVPLGKKCVKNVYP